jgi:hypothetical protein
VSPCVFPLKLLANGNEKHARQNNISTVTNIPNP